LKPNRPSYAYTEEKELNASIGRRNVLRNISIYKYEASTLGLPELCSKLHILTFLISQPKAMHKENLQIDQT
jgi:ribosomal protein L30E